MAWGPWTAVPGVVTDMVAPKAQPGARLRRRLSSAAPALAGSAMGRCPPSLVAGGCTRTSECEEVVIPGAGADVGELVGTCPLQSHLLERNAATSVCYH